MYQMINMSNLARLAFFLYMFFIIFGTSAPFQEVKISLEDASTSNPINQIAFSLIYFLAFLSLYPKRHQVVTFIHREKFLTIYLAWLLVSVIWSDYPFISFKRWIQIFGMVVVFVAVCLHMKSSEETFKYFRVLLTLYILLTLVSVTLVPAASMYDNTAWRGLASHKNILGQIALASVVVWGSHLWDKQKRIQKYNLFFLILSMIVLVGSRSSTSLLTTVLLLIISGYLYLEKNVLRQKADRLIYILLIGFFFFGAMVILYLSPDYIEAAFNFIGEDVTFTGRVELWADIFEYTKQHLFMGSGYAGFWVLNNPKLELIYYKYIWIPLQSHMGYLDLLNETGLIGFSMFLLMLFHYFRTLIKTDKNNYLKWFVITALFVNFQESTLFRIRLLTGVMFALAYIALFIDQMKLASGISHDNRAATKKELGTQ